jgi:hypothetical protein
MAVSVSVKAAIIVKRSDLLLREKPKFILFLQIHHSLLRNDAAKGSLPRGGGPNNLDFEDIPFYQCFKESKDCSRAIYIAYISATPAPEAGRRTDSHCR